MMNTTTVPEYGIFDTFFTTVGVFVTSLALSFGIVAQFMPSHRDDDDTEEIPFKRRFYEEFSELSSEELSKEQKMSLKSVFLDKETDEGRVVMCYDHERGAFDYWCDNSNINYLELDACAQKYAIDNNCKDCVIDYKKEYDTAFEEWLESKKKNDDEHEGATSDAQDNMPEHDVFATFKSYNKKENKISGDGDNKKPVINVKNANQFRRGGSIKDYETSMAPSDAESDSEDKSKKISYSDWVAQEKTKKEN